MVIDLAMQIKNKIKQLITDRADLQQRMDSLKAERDTLMTALKQSQEDCQMWHDQFDAENAAHMETHKELNACADVRDKAIAERDELKGELAIREKMCDELQEQVDSLTKQLAYAELRACSDFVPKCEVCDRTSLLEEIEGLTKERDRYSELITARGKTIETLEHMLAERKGKYREVREQMLAHQRNVKAERDEYRDLYEAAMSTDYAQVTCERDELRDQIKQIRSIITDETTND